MIDVRLTATNPEDSTLVPVPCNSRGELLTVAPKIEKIPNDVEIEGDLTVTGLINGSSGVGEPGPPGPPGEPGGQGPPGEKGDPGVGVPLPYGSDGSTLQIANGVPTWVEPPPVPGAFWANIDEKANLVDTNGNPITSNDPLQYLEGLDSWLKTDNYEKAGSLHEWDTLNNSSAALDFSFVDAFGKIMTLYWTAETKIYSNNSAGDWYRTWQWDNANLVLVSEEGPVVYPPGYDVTVYGGWKISWLINRDIESAKFNWKVTSNQGSMPAMRFRGWELVDTETYSINRIIEFEQKMKRLEETRLSGMTTDIDLSRPTQD
jgi:hypothetical protein